MSVRELSRCCGRRSRPTKASTARARRSIAGPIGELRPETLRDVEQHWRLSSESTGGAPPDPGWSPWPRNLDDHGNPPVANGGESFPRYEPSKIEANAKPILQDLVYAKGRTLSAGDQRTLATWAFLKACVFDELHPTERVVPIEHRRRLSTYEQAPVSGVAIWLGTYEAGEVGHYAYQGLKVGVDGSPDPEEPNIYIVTITTGALAVQIAGSLVPALAFDDLSLPSELHVAKIWPAGEHDLQFPQNFVMQHETLLGFSTMLYNVMGRLTGGAPPAR